MRRFIPFFILAVIWCSFARARSGENAPRDSAKTNRLSPPNCAHANAGYGKNTRHRFWRALLSLNSIDLFRQTLDDGLLKNDHLRMLDAGGGLSIAGLRMAREPRVQTYLVDFYDYYHELIARPLAKPEPFGVVFDENRNLVSVARMPAEAIIQLVSALKIRLPDGWGYDRADVQELRKDSAERVIRIASDYKRAEIQRDLSEVYTQILKKISALPNFSRHRMSIQSFFIAHPNLKFHLILDRYAVFLHAGDRAGALQLYYEHLTDDGLVVVRTSDRRLRNRVLPDGTPAHLDQLFEKFGTVFSQERDAILMRKDPNISAQEIFGHLVPQRPASFTRFRIDLRDAWDPAWDRLYDGN